jgi:hypothetical protein
MNRDDMPTGADVASATADLFAAARRTVAALPLGADQAAAVAAVRSALGQLWPKVMPEAVRDVMVSAAQLACEYGVTELPTAVVGQYTAGPLDGAAGMLELTGQWIAEGRPAPANGLFTPPMAFASSVAFDRDEDEETLTSLAALLALAADVALADPRSYEAAIRHRAERAANGPGPHVFGAGFMRAIGEELGAETPGPDREAGQ